MEAADVEVWPRCRSGCGRCTRGRWSGVRVGVELALAEALGLKTDELHAGDQVAGGIGVSGCVAGEIGVGVGLGVELDLEARGEGDLGDLRDAELRGDAGRIVRLEEALLKLEVADRGEVGGA